MGVFILRQLYVELLQAGVRRGGGCRPVGGFALLFLPEVPPQQGGQRQVQGDHRLLHRPVAHAGDEEIGGGQPLGVPPLIGGNAGQGPGGRSGRPAGPWPGMVRASISSYRMNDCSSAPWTAEAVPRQGTLPPDGSIGPGSAQVDTPGSGGGRVGHGIGEAGGGAAGTAGTGYGASSPRSITGESYRSSGMTRRHTRSKISRSLPHRPGPGSGRNPLIPFHSISPPKS